MNSVEIFVIYGNLPYGVTPELTRYDVPKNYSSLSPSEKDYIWYQAFRAYESKYGKNFIYNLYKQLPPSKLKQRIDAKNYVQRGEKVPDSIAKDIGWAIQFNKMTSTEREDASKYYQAVYNDLIQCPCTIS